jgi:hypothetical protein
VPGSADPRRQLLATFASLLPIAPASRGGCWSSMSRFIMRPWRSAVRQTVPECAAIHRQERTHSMDETLSDEAGSPYRNGGRARVPCQRSLRSAVNKLLRLPSWSILRPPLPVARCPQINRHAHDGQFEPALLQSAAVCTRRYIQLLSRGLEALLRLHMSRSRHIIVLVLKVLIIFRAFYCGAQVGGSAVWNHTRIAIKREAECKQNLELAMNPATTGLQRR